MAQSKVFNKYMALIKKRMWTENEIIYFRKALGYCSALAQDQKDCLRVQFLKRGEHRITEVQSVRGILYLKDKAFKANGELRNTKDFPFGNFELSVIRSFKRFSFVDLAPQYNGIGEVICYAPVYRVHGRTGTFDYVAYPFGQITVCRIAPKTMKAI